MLYLVRVQRLYGVLCMLQTVQTSEYAYMDRCHTSSFMFFFFSFYLLQFFLQIFSCCFLSFYKVFIRASCCCFHKLLSSSFLSCYIACKILLAVATASRKTQMYSFLGKIWIFDMVLFLKSNIIHAFWATKKSIFTLRQSINKENNDLIFYAI